MPPCQLLCTPPSLGQYGRSSTPSFLIPPFQFTRMLRKPFRWLDCIKPDCLKETALSRKVISPWNKHFPQSRRVSLHCWNHFFSLSAYPWIVLRMLSWTERRVSPTFLNEGPWPPPSWNETMHIELQTAKGAQSFTSHSSNVVLSFLG